MNKEIPRLYRSRDERIIAGVCGGIAEYFAIDPTIVRALFLILGLGMGSGIIIYFIMALIVPLKPLEGEPSTPSSVDQLTEQARGAIEKMAGKAEEAFTHAEKKNDHEGFRTIFGLFLVVLGLIALLGMVIPLPRIAWHIIWPILLIIFGISILTKHK